MVLTFKDNPFTRKKKAADAAVVVPAADPAGMGAMKLKPSIAAYIAAEVKDFKSNLTPYLPADLIGGSVPHVPGTEEEAVWNAAAQACGTEKVHFCYSVEQGRCWYLACPSSSLASSPDSWCPLAAALPGNSEYWDRQTVYLYEQEGQASALRWDPETGRMQVFLGAARTLLPRIQSMDANFVTINPEVAQTVPWRNRALRSEQLSRAAARLLLYAGLLLNGVVLLVLLFNYASIGFVKRDLETVRQKTETASLDLMTKAYSAMQSDTIKHMVRIQQLLDTLQQREGTLVRYQIEKGKVEWEALVPQVYSGGDAVLKGTVQPKVEKDGRVRLKGSS